jgi:hypothetical protein
LCIESIQIDMGDYAEWRGRRALTQKLQLAVGVLGMGLHGMARGGGRCDERVWGRARHIENGGTNVMLALLAACRILRQ